MNSEETTNKCTVYELYPLFVSHTNDMFAPENKSVHATT